MAEPNNGLDIPKIVVVLVTIIGGIVALILNLSKLVALAKRLFQWLVGRWRMFNEWRYWRKYSPTILVESIEPLYVRETDGTITLKLTVNWVSREDIFPTVIEDGDIMADVGKYIPYLIHRPRPNNWELLPNEKIQKSYVLEAKAGLRAKTIRSEVKCQLFAPSIRLELLSGTRKIRLKPLKRQVIWLNS